MPSVGFKCMSPMLEQQRTILALDCVATLISLTPIMKKEFREQYGLRLE
jgi:hypothetical protein